MRVRRRNGLVSDATSRTLLFRNPSVVSEPIISVAERKSPIRPIPTGPITTEMILVRTMAQMMEITCTPPNTPIDFTILFVMLDFTVSD